MLHIVLGILKVAAVQQDAQPVVVLLVQAVVQIITYKHRTAFLPVVRDILRTLQQGPAFYARLTVILVQVPQFVQYVMLDTIFKLELASLPVVRVILRTLQEGPVFYARLTVILVQVPQLVLHVLMDTMLKLELAC